MPDAAAPPPGPLVGRGRAADVYDVGGGRVLRRYRGTRSAGTTRREVIVMRHLAEHGFPVPGVHDVDGDDVVMDRLDGVTMLSCLERAPWRWRRLSDTWAELHRRLAAVPVGALAHIVPARFGPPDAIIHLDFHPDNIMLPARGPVVFDWTNVALGPAAADVAQSWIVAATSSADGPWLARQLVTALRRRVVDRFVDGCDRTAAAELVPAVGEARLGDPNVRPEEAERIRAMIAAHR